MMGKVAFLFPGQGSQGVGMGRELAGSEPLAAQVFQDVDGVLGFPLSRLMFEGPEEELTLTRNTQPALVAVSMALYRLLRERAPALTPDCVAGHSLGEYAALCAAGGFSLADAIRLVHVRGRAMQEAVPPGEGGMAALLSPPPGAVETLCRKVAEETGRVCVPANYNSPAQVVISGHKAAIDRALALAPGEGIKRSVPLAVSAPFHSPLMAPAARVMEEALGQTTLHDLAMPLIANVTAQEVTRASEIRGLLVAQVTGSVLWEASVRRMLARGVTLFVEIGWGQVLTGLVKRIDKEVRAVAVNGPGDFAQLESLL